MYPFRSNQFTVPHSPSKRTFAKLACIFSLCFAAAPLAPALNAGASSTSIGFTLGSTSTVLGPTWHIDMPFSTHGTTPNAIAYTGNTMTWGYTTSNLLNLTPLPGIALAQGTNGNFDGCSSGGAWLNSTYTDPSNPTFVRGWYHAESGCNSAGNRKSVGYAESYDGGHTFTKPNYPNNRVITAPSRFTDPNQGSEGDQHVIKVGSYFYMYFVAAWDSFKIHLARSLVSDGGRPGTWWKYYNGSFSQPGLGGESSALASGSVLGRAWVSYNTSLGAYMGFSWSTQGFGISISSNGINNWTQVSGTLLSTDHTFWGRGPGSGELIEYMSLIGLDGNPDVQGGDLWLYYMRIPAGQPASGDTRYLVRRSVHISGGTGGGGGTYTFAPSADSSVKEAQPTTNWGTSTDLHVSGVTGSRQQTYISFNVSGVTGTVQNVKLRVYAYGGTSNGPSVYSSSSSWSESGITWNNRPALTSGAVDDKGYIATNSWVEYNVTSLVSSTGNGTYSFVLSTTSTDPSDFYSRQGSPAPQLVITSN